MKQSQTIDPHVVEYIRWRLQFEGIFLTIEETHDVIKDTGINIAIISLGLRFKRFVERVADKTLKFLHL